MREDLNSLTATVYYDKNFIGCGVFYCHAGLNYAITAGHNFYGTSFSDVRDLNKFVVYSHDKKPFQVEEVLGDAGFAQEHDIILLKLKRLDSNSEHIFTCPVLKCGPIDNSCYLVNTNNYGDSTSYTNFLQIKYDTMVAGTTAWFYVDVDGKYLSDAFGGYGPEALDGISGSGIFLDRAGQVNERILLGIVIEVPKEKPKNKFTCVCVSLLKHLLPDIEVGQFKKGIVEDDIGALLDQLEEQHTDSAIRDWMNKQAGSEVIENLNRKTQMIYPESRIERERIRIIRNFLQGKAVYQKRIESDAILKNKYNKANRAFYSRDDLFVYTADFAEGKTKLEALFKAFEGYLDPVLSPHLDAAEIGILTSYNLADCITNCTIDFIKK
jgi:hypothetical protein